jgi:hypothetical protein
MMPRKWLLLAVLSVSVPVMAQPAAAPPKATPPVPDPSALVAPTESSPSAGAAPSPPPESLPPPAYYLEPPQPRRAAPPAAEPPLPAEPPPPLIWEPPPPPVPRHVAPRTSLWAGARLGWFVPFGGVFAQGVASGTYLERQSVPWRDFVASGPLLELHLGARIARSYNVFLLWERAQPGQGKRSVYGDPDSSETDFWGLGLRASSDANKVGFLTEVALGYRRARTEFSDGSALELTDGVLEARIGLGADIRLSPLFTLSPTATLGVGSFGDVEWVSSDGVATDLIGPFDDHDAHGWFTLGLGAHFDLFGRE